MSIRRKLIEKAKSGGYGFNKEYVLTDRRLLGATSENFYDCLFSAVLWYANWQLQTVKTYYYYNTNIVIGICENIQKQLKALETFGNDWRVAELLDNP